MMRTFTIAAAVLAAALVSAPDARAALWSKTYNFKPGVTLEVGAELESGLRLESVRFQMPTFDAPSAREATVEVTVSNPAGGWQKMGVAVALFDNDGRLVGVADGGTSLIPLRGGRFKVYRLVFQNVNSAAPLATTFQISVESGS